MRTNVLMNIEALNVRSMAICDSFMRKEIVNHMDVVKMARMHMDAPVTRNFVHVLRECLRSS